MKGRRTAYLALGSNLGDTTANIMKMCDRIERRVGEIVSRSTLIQTNPEGFDSLHTFANCVISVSTHLSPPELLKETRVIEKEMGRTNKSKDGEYQDRTADIDIILYEDVILSIPELEIPHPRFRERTFVLGPLAEIAPDLIDPITGKTISNLLEILLSERLKTGGICLE